MVSPVYIVPQVFFQECDLRKSFSTSVAIMWLLICVGSNRKPLVCIHSYLPFQFKHSKESFPQVLQSYGFSPVWNLPCGQTSYYYMQNLSHMFYE